MQITPTAPAPWPAHQIGDWQDVRAFYEAARCGSYRAAADHMQTNATTVSRRVRNLERRLGARLVVRVAHGIRLTPLGERVLLRAQEVDTLLRRIHSDVKLASTAGGPLRLAASDGFGAYWLPKVVADLHDEHPEIQLEVFVTNEVPDLARLEADLAITFAPPQAADIVVLSEFTVQLMAFASEGYIQRHGRPATLEELRSHRLIDRTERPGHPSWDEWAALTEDNPNVVSRTNSSVAAGYMTRHGAGIALHPVGVARTEPDFVPLPIPGLAPEVHYWLICHREMRNVPRMRTVIDFLRRKVFPIPVQQD
ncbi:MAG TPA: LysR family transcriptional regulator [Alphaproteobacteria bacterium]|nr:LysR family transcriptional regulator [Alphaproteobacteria bacterium]